VDIWRAIDFLEKVLERGTDVEVLQAKGHTFRNHEQLQMLQNWRGLAQEGRSATSISAGWTSDTEGEAVLSMLASLKAVAVNPAAVPPSPPTAKPEAKKPAEKTKLKWADLFEEPETEDTQGFLGFWALQGILARKESSSNFAAEPESLEVGAFLLLPQIDSQESLGVGVARSEAVEQDQEELNSEEAAVPEASASWRPRRRRPRGRGGSRAAEATGSACPEGVV